MGTVLLLCRLVLFAVFAVAGLGKLTDRAGAQRAVEDFGVPALLAVPLALLLPLAELAVAVALLPLVSAWWAAVGALALLLLFSAATGVALARGRRPDCHCFGQIAAGPIGWQTLVRNGMLALIGAFVVWQGRTNAGAGITSWLAPLSAFERTAVAVAAALVVVVAAEAWLLLQMLQQQGRLLLRLEAIEQGAGSPAADAPAPAVGLPIGAPAPGFQLGGLYGETLTLDALRAAARPVLLVFADPHCGPCSALMPDVGRWQRDLAAGLSLAIVSRGDLEGNRAKAREHGLTLVLLQQDSEVSNAYQAWGTPSAVLVQADGRIGSAVAQGAEAIRALVARQGVPGAAGTLPIPVPVVQPQAAGAPCPNCGQVHPPAPPASQQGLPAGTPAPALKLPDLDGNEVDLGSYRGRETALIFWNPGCGFCQQLLPQLKAWEVSRPADAPALIVVSAGSLEANRAQGIASTVVLDQSFGAGTAFGASGTPSAVLVGQEGAIASSLAVGATAVMALLTGGPSQPPAG